MLIQPTTGIIAIGYSSMKAVTTLSTKFRPSNNNATAPAISPIFHIYHEQFNVIDLFNRKYYELEFPHWQCRWTDDFFNVFLRTAVHNAWVLYCTWVNPNCDLPSFYVLIMISSLYFCLNFLVSDAAYNLSSTEDVPKRLRKGCGCKKGSQRCSCSQRVKLQFNCV